ncbi:MAG TPA: non-ribosomal peptide synthase/polyketide synthase [Thermoanaerobaculia bacterium]|nr:non-ribosomal peptide synthase/polyketide synthase [Thermoanaerobaculia bacterium]
MVISDLTGFRLSPQQEHLWRAQGSRPARGFACQGLLELRGPLDRGRLRHAVERTVERHEILRTSFQRLPGMSLPIQVIQDRGGVLWSEPETSGTDEAEAERLLTEARRFPFPLEDGTALQASLISLGEERHALLLTLPALAADALSLRVLAHEIALLYSEEKDAQGLPDPLQYADAAESLQEWLGPEDGPGAAFWRQQGSPFLHPADAADHPVPETVYRRLPAGSVAELAHPMEVSIPFLLLAVWSAALWWETGEERHTIAVAHDGRTSDELSWAIGPYARYLPVQSVAGPGLTLGELARSLDGAATTTAAWQDAFSLDRLTAGSAGEGSMPLWPVGFDSDRTAVFSPAISLVPGFVGLGRFGLRLSVLEEGTTVRLDLHYDPTLHDRGRAERLLDRLERVLAGAAADPEALLGEIDVLTEAERRELLVAFNDTAAPYPAEATVCDLFEETVRLAPQAPAVAAAEGISLTFEELNTRANRLARHLRALGIGPESRVGIHLEREPEMVVALLAVLKAGGAYVPFDAGHPAERLRFLMQDAGLAALMTRERLRPAGMDTIRTILADPDGTDAAAISRQDSSPLPRLAGPGNAAYVIYTSGSTGLPKGVVVTHRGLINYLCWARTAYEAGPGRGAPVHSPLGFDLTVTSLFVPLLRGAAITLLPEEDGIGALAEALRAPGGQEEGAFGLVKITPAHLGLLSQLTPDGEPPPSAACLVIGGDALWTADIAPWRRGGTRIFNEYGPTETVVGCAVHEVGPGSPETGAVPIGRPIANTRLYVMGPGLRPVPAGVPGELWIGGDGVTRGYLGRPGLTAERFVPDPFASPDRAGGRLYRTGDLVRLSPSGTGLELEFLGRIDDQVKIRGHRVEPGEVAAALASHPGLRDAAVALRGQGSDRRLVAWVVARDRARRPTATELRRFLAGRLPEPMIPAAFVQLDILPLTPNGKLDRRALPDPDRNRDEETPYAPPRTLSEEVLAEVWGQVLGVDQVGIDDHFFSLGGDSIRSLQVISLAQKRGLLLTVQDLFERPTIRSLVERVRLPGQDVKAPGQTGPFSLIDPKDRGLLPDGIEDAYPLGRLQAGMLFHSELAPESAIYHDLHSFHVRAAFAADRMREAVHQVSLLHPVLRTSFDLASFSESLQLVHRGLSVPLEVHDLSGLPEPEREAALSDWLDRERLRAFDWTQPPLVHFHVHVRDEGSFQFTMSFHHAILDGWSAASLLTDLFRRYALLLRGEEPPSDAPLAVAYRDFVALERAAAASEKAQSFWRLLLDGAEPTRLPRLAASAAGLETGARQVQARVDPELSDGAKRVAREAEVPIKSLLLAVHLKVASVLGGAHDVLTGLVSHGRPEHTDGDRILGLFLNTLPFRVSLRGGTWRELAREVFDLERRMLPFRHFPLAGMRDVESSQLSLEMAFNYLHYHVYNGAADVRGIEVQGYQGYEETNFPLITQAALEPFSRNLQLAVAYRTSDLDAGEAERFAAYLLRALAAAVESPAARYDAVALLSAAELAQILESPPGFGEPLPVEPLHHRFERQAARTPGATALVWEGQRMSYAELEAAANRLAQHLRFQGVGPEARVAVLLERSAELVVALLAILKAGGAYVPLDPAYPAERIAFILADSAALLLVTEEKLAQSLPASPIQLVRIDTDRDPIRARPDVGPAVQVEPGNLAYIIYTSGSTGSPKGVQVTHANAARLFAATDELFGFGPGDVWTFFHSVAFDFSVWEIWGALLYGGRLVVVPHEVTRSPEDFHALLAAESVTVLNQTPSAFQQLAAWEQEAAGASELSLRLVIFGGEALNLASLRPWFERHGDVRPRLVNMYGITETTVHVTFRPVSAADPELGNSPIGGPLPDLRLYLLAADGSPVPVGVPGEIHVGGAGLARGYLGRPALTAERFVPDPLGGGAGERLYRSGDLARRQPDGSLEYLGRIDHQVKIRGFRIELGEIESALAGLAGVREAVVVPREDTPGDRRLVAYVAGEVETDPLRQSLRERLPDYMVPAAFVILPELPLTPNGKVDRKALPAPEWQRTAKSYQAPRTPVEEVLAGIWAEILGLERVGAADHFFDLGGHSLLATRVMSRLRGAFEVEMPLRDLFEAPVLADLAARIEAARRSDAVPPAPPLVPVPRERPLPLSFAQQRLWFIDQIEPGNPAYNIPGAVRLSGPLDFAALAASLGGVTARHESLRTTFPASPDGVVQHIAPPSPPALPLIDLSALPATVRESAALRVLRGELLRPFDLARGPLLRARLLRLGDEEHWMVLTLHHIVSDGWSMGVLVREVAAFYAAALEGGTPGLPGLPVQYADFAVWQRGWLSGPVLDEQIAYWRERLSGAPLVLDLPADRPRPPIPSGRGGTRSALLPVPLSEALAALGRRQGVTLFMTLFAGFAALLHRHTSAEDLIVGTDVANRNRVETEGLIGFFVNQLALRARPQGSLPWRQLLAQVRETALGAYAHQDLPFERLVEELQPERDLSRQPVFQISFVLQNVPVGAISLSSLSLSPLGGGGGTARLDLALEALESPFGLQLRAEHALDLFDGVTIGRLLGHYETLLAAVAADPDLRLSEPSLLHPAERQQALLEWNDSAEPVHDGLPLHRLFAEVATAAPGAVAAACLDEQRTYGELAGSVRLLAARLAAEGVGPETVVPLLADRGLDFLTAVLGVFRAGGAYLPLDPLHPGRRLAQLVADCGARVVVAARSHAARLSEALDGLPVRLFVLEDLLQPGDTPAEDVDADAVPSGLAYLIYTSGSTGAPKGAMVEQNGMLNHLRAKISALRLSREDAVAQTASQCFDISVWQLLAALLVGGRVEIFPDDLAHDPLRLLAEVERRGVTVLETVPSLLRLLIEELEARGQARPALASLRWMIPTGEALPPDLCHRWLRLYPGIPLLNAYGPTECSDDVTHHPIREVPPSGEAQTPIGRPVPNLRLYVLDSGGLPSPAGVPGELFVGGTGVGRGYFGDSVRTAESFVPDPFSTAGERLYRTGDLARVRADGTIEFLGRRDHQVKIRGHRIELGEIEAVLTRHPALRAAAVAAREDVPGNKRLIAYVVPRPEDGAVDELVPRLRAHVAERLPDSMMPAAFVMLDELPLTPNGKLDRRALPAPDPVRPDLTEGYAAPRLPVEETLARIWAQVLRLDRVGVHDNFFELGGDSILSIQVVTRASQAGLRLTPRQMFLYQTIAELAAVADTAPAELADQGAVIGEVTLTPIQRWFFFQRFLDPNRWNQSVLLALREPVDPALVEQAFDLLLTHHDALRLRFLPGGELPRQVSAAPGGNAPFTRVDLSALPAAERSPAQAVAADQVHDGLDLARGPIARAAFFDLGPDAPGRLLIVVHHLAVDGVSWRILLDDLELACRALARGEAPVLPPKTLSFRDWAARLVEHGQLVDERDVWLAEPRRRVTRLPVDTPGGANTMGSVRTVTAALGAEETQALLQEVPRAYRTRINDALLTAMARTLAGWTGDRRVLVDMESHGREDLFGGPEADLSRTVGWFTSEYPLLLALGDSGDPGDDLRAVKEQLRAVPHSGLGYGLLRYLGDRETAELLAALPAAELIFNYLGQLDQTLAQGPQASLFSPLREPEGAGQTPRERRTHLLEITASVIGGRLVVTWLYSHRLHRPETIERLAEGFLEHLRDLIAHCRAAVESRSARYTPSDFPLARLGQDDLDRLLGTRWGIEDLYPLSPLQEGILFESLYAPGSGVYVEQVVCRLDGALHPAALAEAFRRIVERHPVLRTSFHWLELDRPLQALHSRAEIELEQEDWTDCAPAEQAARLAAVLDKDRQRGFDLTRAPLIRWFLARTGPGEHRLLWTHHHILLDGWSFASVAGEFLACYHALRDGAEPQLARRRPYRDYIAWLETQDLASTEEYWRRALAGWTEPTPLPAGSGAAAQRPGSELRKVVISEPAMAVLQALARSQQLTLNTLVAGAWAVLLGRYGGKSEVVFGTTASGRAAPLQGIEEMVGLFINTLPLRVPVDDRLPLVPWLKDLQLRQAELIQHEHTPLPRVQTCSELPPGTRLFDSILVFENWPLDNALRQGGFGLDVAEVRALERTGFPLTLVAVPGHGLSLDLEYDTARIDTIAAVRILAQVAHLLEELAESPLEKRIEDLSLLTPAERHQLLAEWNDTAPARPAGLSPLHRLIEEQADRTPEAVAVVFEDGELTYRDLDRRANHLAFRLLELGIGPDSLVAICMERSAGLVPALLAILKAGGAYVPLDPDLPHERLAFLLTDTRASVVLTESRLADRVPPGARVVCVDGAEAAGEESARPSVPLHSENLAYVIYTSGSTGRPKGVLISHRNLASYLAWARATYPAEGAGTLLHTSISFDLTVTSLFLPLISGQRVNLVSGSAGIEALGEALRGGSDLSFLKLTPSHARLLGHQLAAGELAGRSRSLILGGEALHAEELAPWRESAPETIVYNEYGPTEATVGCAVHAVLAGALAGGAVPVGRPIDGARLYLFDPRLEPVPVGVPGELWIGGEGLARGYLERPDLTAERFRPDPTGGSAGGRLYRTGDLARFLPDGSIEFLGRLDFQVKIRGFRIELGEIEAALLEHDGVQEAVVVARDHEAQGRILVAYVVPRGGEIAAEALREALLQRLPQHMVPTLYVALPALPLTGSGKVDRKALPAPESQRRSQGRRSLRHRVRAAKTYLAPRTPVEEVLSGIWAEILGVERVGANDHFFDLGGHSVLATRLVSRLRSTFNVEITLRELFAAPVLSDLAVRIETARRSGAVPPAPPLVPVPREGPLPLSFAQQRLWFLDQLEPGSPLYNIPVALRIEGPLRSEVLALCLGEITRRHEALRTVFAAPEGSPVQVIQPPAPFTLSLADLSGLPETDREALLPTLVAEEAGRPFDLARGPLLRGVLFRLAGDDHVAVLTLHHIVSDGWSMGILVREITALYAAFSESRPSPLAELPVQYADFAVWQRSWLQGEVLESEIEFWRQQLAGLPPLLTLPTDRPRPAVQSFRGAARPVRLSAELARQAQVLGRREGATLFMVLLAGFQVLLSRYSGQQDLAVGTPVAGHNRVEVEGLIGFFVNTLVLRGTLSGGRAGEPSFRELLGRARETTLAAHMHQDVPFERLVQELSPERSLAQTPLFQAMLTLQNASAESLDIEHLRVRPFGGAEKTSKFDLTLSLEEHDGGLGGVVEHATDLFDAATIDRLIGHLERLLAAAVAAPDSSAFALPLLSPAERGQILVEWNNTGTASEPRDCLHELFEAQVRRTPEAVALIAGGRELRYLELDQAADRLAGHLRRRGAGPEAVVGVCLERSADLVTALLAILKAGAAYLPLDPQLPRLRLAGMLTSARASCVVSSRRLAAAEEIPWSGTLILVDQDLDPETGEDGYGHPGRSAVPENLAYVLYTSGSTGTPKGVAVTHQSAVELVRWAGTVYAPEDLAGVLAATALSFDLSVFELFVPLCWGGTVILAQNVLELPQLLSSGPSSGRVTLVNTVPSAMAELVREGSLGASVRTVNLAGEPVPRSLVERIYATGTVERVWNLYGPSEDTTYSTFAQVARESSAAPSIGRPITATRAYVLASGLEPVPVGVLGELYLAGAGLARGYLHRPDLTAERFVPDLFSAEPGARLYRTGDLVRWLPDGSLDFQGRLDHQVKVRGFRIELGEIEAALLAVAGIREAVVMAREDRSETGPGDRRLVAYVAGEVAVDALRQSLRERLPDYMIPASFVMLSELPRSASGKVDRKALPSPDRPAAAAAYEEPQTAAEREIAEIWRDLLGVERVGLHDNFFDLGGHSLLMVRVRSRLAHQWGRELTMVDLFSHPTVSDLARLLTGAEEESEATPVRSAGSEERMAGGKERLQRLRQGASTVRRAR